MSSIERGPIFEVRLLRRRGVAVPRWQYARLPTYRGALAVTLSRDPVEDVRRRCATLVQPNNQRLDPPGALWSPHLIRATVDSWELRGLECVSDDGGSAVMVYQVWYMEPVR